jgi:hypothetical protein
MRKHTPGPWRYEYEPGYNGELIAANGTVIAEFISEPRPPNARLIAAAPDLLRACQDLLDRYKFVVGNEGVECYLARAAIAKATGEA